MYITVLCKVVDNFGDIGVAWRLCRRLTEIQSKYKINLIVDDFQAFSKIEKEISRHCEGQANQAITIDNISIYRWQDSSFCSQEFSINDGEKLSIILELFQCGRPEWMENLLFEKKLSRTVQIIMIDYLTAEKYAEDFHCLKSLTRSARVQKVNFMPGFTEKTGGLIIDKEWKSLPPYNKAGPVMLFTYESDWSALASALKACGKKILLAPGRGKESFLQAWNSSQTKADSLQELPFLNQPEWDKLMKNSSLLIVRGEESMSRACLSGIPFIWQAYPQSEDYQLVKVKALLERMKPHFSEEAYCLLERAWLEINQSASISQAQDLSKASSSYTSFISSLDRLLPGFQTFAQALRKNGDLASNLMTFIEKIAIML